MKMSNEGKKVTKYFESLKLRAYPDPATTPWRRVSISTW